MAPRASGAIETHVWRGGRTVTIRARMRAYGRRYRVDFGTNHEGWSVERARVRRGAGAAHLGADAAATGRARR